MLAVELNELIRDEIDIEINAVKFFTDSKIVLSYIHNSTRRFYMYVSNRVTRIRRSTHSDQWFYVPTDTNPADHATRPIPATQLLHSNWFSGPAFLYHDDSAETPDPNLFSLVDPEAENEIRPEVTTLATKALETQLGSQHFERFSSWSTLSQTIARLIHVASSFKGQADDAGKKGWKCFKGTPSISELSKAKAVIIRSVQHEAFQDELKHLKNKQAWPRSNTLKKLNPFVLEVVLRLPIRQKKSSTL